MFPPTHKMPAVAVALGLSAGILCHYYSVPWWAVAIVAAISLVLTLTRRNLFVGFAGVAVVVGWVIACAYRPPLLPTGAGGTMTTVVGRVTDMTPRADRLDMVVEVDSARSLPGLAGCRVLVNGVVPYRQPLPGALVRVAGFITDPYAAPEVPHCDTRSAEALSRGVTAILYADHNGVSILAQGIGLKARLMRLRQRMADVVYDSGLSGSAADFICGITLGDATLLHPDVRNRFRQLGVAHILALSGFHVGVIAWLIMLLCFPLRIVRHGWLLSWMLTIFAVWGYVAVVGTPLSAVRAALLVTIVGIGYMLGRRPVALNSLAVAACLMLAVNPYDLFDPGFQLSYAAVAALILFMPVLNPWDQAHDFRRTLGAWLTIPLAAMLGTGVVSVMHFHTLPLLFLPANLVVGLVAPLLIPVGLLLIVAGLCGLHMPWLDQLINYAYDLMQRVCGVLDFGARTTLSDIYLQPLTLLITACGILAAVWAVKRRRLWAWLPAAACVALAMATEKVAALRVPTVELHMPSGASPSIMLVRHDTVAAIHSFGYPGEALVDYATADRRYGRWARRGGASAIQPFDSLQYSGLRHHGRLIQVGRTNLLQLSDSNAWPAMEVDYVIISRPGALTINQIHSRYPRAGIIMACGLRRKNAERLKAEARACGVSLHSVADSGWSLMR